MAGGVERHVFELVGHRIDLAGEGRQGRPVGKRRLGGAAGDVEGGAAVLAINVGLEALARSTSSRFASSASSSARIWAASRPALLAPASPIASVPTGTPAGICTIDSRLSWPERALLDTGTPRTGSIVIAAVMPGRCAAPPAPAMITLSPRALALLAY